MEKVLGKAQMRRLVVAAALCCGLVAGVAPIASARAAKVSPPRAARDEPGLVGTWRLVRYENTSADGKVSYPFGEHPFGYFVYDPTGHLSVQIMHNPPIAAPSPASGPQPPGDAAPRAFIAYFGAYKVDKAKGVLHHIVEGALDPNYVANPDQVRPYRLRGDTLIIELTDPKTARRAYRELHRVK